MALLSGAFRTLSSISSSLFRDVLRVPLQAQQVRTKFIDRMQMKDQKRRVALKHFGGERLLLTTLYRCKFLPREIRDVAQTDIEALPRDSNFIRCRPRCYATSRPRACIKDFRVSRIVFRHLADYNKLSGVQRAMW